MLGTTAEPTTLAHYIINASHRDLCIKLTSHTILTASISIIQDLQKQLSTNDMANTKVCLVVEIGWSLR